MALQPPMEKDQGWKVLTAPELQKWDKIGTTISGKLLSIDKIEINGKMVPQYLIAPTGESRLKFLGPYDLMQKLTRAHVGMLTRIKYLGEDETVKKNGNAMKVFDVHVRVDPDEQRHGGPITDEDIPF